MKANWNVAALLLLAVTLSGCGGLTLHEVAATGDAGELKSLLARGADVKAKDENGWTALIHAAANGNADTARVLLLEGADVNAKNARGLTALMLAEESKGIATNKSTHQDYLETVKVLLQYGAGPKLAREPTPPTTSSPTADPRPPGGIPFYRSWNVAESLPLEAPFLTRAVTKWLSRLEPNQGGAIWLSLLVTVLVAFNLGKLVCRRNADLLLLLAPSLLMVDMIRYASGSLEDPEKVTISGLVFSGLLLFSAVLLIRSLFGVFGRASTPWTPNVSQGVLGGVLLILLTCNTLVVFERMAEDCGFYTNLGAAQMIKTGNFPYGDPVLHGGAAATYGPVLYLAHIPFQLAISPVWPTVERSQHEGGPLLPEPPIVATKLVLLCFHFLGVLALVMIGRRLAGLTVGFGLACLYVASPYVLGLGGDEHFTTGLAFISHIAPTAVMLLAFAMLPRPWVAGALLAVAAGVLFYSAFFFLPWLGYYFWRGREWRKFAIGFLIVATLIAILVLSMTQPIEGKSHLWTVYEATVGHQEAQHGYGASTFSFWRTHPEISSLWQKRFLEDYYLVRPSVIIFMLFMVGSFFMAKGLTLSQFAFLTGALAIAIQLWKSHAGGTYVEWYYPFLLIGILGQAKGSQTSLPPKEDRIGSPRSQSTRDSAA